MKADVLGITGEARLPELLAAERRAVGPVRGGHAERTEGATKEAAAKEPPQKSAVTTLIGGRCRASPTGSRGLVREPAVSDHCPRQLGGRHALPHRNPRSRRQRSSATPLRPPRRLAAMAEASARVPSSGVGQFGHVRVRVGGSFTGSPDHGVLGARSLCADAGRRDRPSADCPDAELDLIKHRGQARSCSSRRAASAAPGASGVFDRRTENAQRRVCTWNLLCGYHAVVLDGLDGGPEELVEAGADRFHRWPGCVPAGGYRWNEGR